MFACPLGHSRKKGTIIFSSEYCIFDIPSEVLAMANLICSLVIGNEAKRNENPEGWAVKNAVII